MLEGYFKDVSAHADHGIDEWVAGDEGGVEWVCVKQGGGR